MDDFSTLMLVWKTHVSEYITETFIPLFVEKHLGF